MVNSTTLMTKAWWGQRRLRLADHSSNPQSFRVEPVQQWARQLNTGRLASHSQNPKSLGSLHTLPGKHLQVPLPQQSLPDCKRHHSSLSPSVHTQGDAAESWNTPPTGWGSLIANSSLYSGPALLPPRVTKTRADSYSDALIYRWTGVVFSCASVALKLRPQNQMGEAPVPLLPEADPSIHALDGWPAVCTGGSFSSERTAAASF